MTLPIAVSTGLFFAVMVHAPRVVSAQYPPRVAAVVPHAPTHLVEAEVGFGTLVDRYPDLTGLTGRLGYTAAGPEWVAQGRLGSTLFLTGYMVVGELLAGRSFWDGQGGVVWFTAGPALTSTRFCPSGSASGCGRPRADGSSPLDVRNTIGLAGEFGASTPKFISVASTGLSVAGNLNRNRSYVSMTVFTGWGLRW